MEQEGKDTENPPEVTSKCELLEEDDSRRDAELSEKNDCKEDAESSGRDESRKNVESSSGKDSIEKGADSSEKDISKKDGELSDKDNKMENAETAPERTCKPGSSDEITPQKSKARPKIVKKSPAGRFKAKNTKGAQGDEKNMEQEGSGKEAENSPDVSFRYESSENVNKDAGSPEKDNGMDAESPEKDDSMKDVESPEKDDNKKDAESPEKDSSEKDTESLEKDNEMKDAEIAPDGTSKPSSSDKNTPQKLKAQQKIVKKSPAGRFKTKKTQEAIGNMEQEESNKDAENSAGMSSENIDSKKGGSAPLEDDNMKDADNSKGSGQTSSSDKNIPKSLKPKQKIMKSVVGRFKTKLSKVVQGDIRNIGQEESQKDTENSPNMSPKTNSSEKANIKDAKNAANESGQPESSDKNASQSLKAKSKIVKKSQVGASKAKKTNDVQGDGKIKKQEDNRKDSEHPPNVSSKPESSEKDSSTKDAENPAVGSSKLESNDKNTPQSLKATPKIVKKSKFKNIKNKVALERQRRRNKTLMGNSDNKYSQGAKRTTDEQPEKSQRDESNNVDSLNRSLGDRILSRKNKGKRGDLTMGAMSKKSKGRDGGIRKSQSNEKNRERVGGLIFMCNAKTKPDCFRYNVMGISAGKKDVVFGIKPGLKLFLYDFDLKMLYGIYKATSSGGLKLEPRAFEGSFPAQVRFSVVKDCYPVPESIFKRAIKENYNEKNKFKTELTVRQVRKLTELFRPVEIHSTLRSARSPPKAIVRGREFHDVARGSKPHSHRDRPAREYYSTSHLNSYNPLPVERDRRIELREEAPRRIELREEAPCRIELREEAPRRIERREEAPRWIERREEARRDLFLTEREYRAYGLQGDRSLRDPPSHVNPRLDPYERDYERDHRQRLSPIYRDNVQVRAETLRLDPPYLDEIKYQAYGLGVRPEYVDDPYHRAYHQGTSSRDLYVPPPLSREEIPSSSYFAGERTLVRADEDLRRRETGHDRRYSTYAAEALSEYNKTRHYNEARPDNEPVPVSSRYAFAGPSYSYR